MSTQDPDPPVRIGVVSALDAAADDLAQVIVILNLEAMPGAIPIPKSYVDGDATPKLLKYPHHRTSSTSSVTYLLGVPKSPGRRGPH